MKRIGTGGQDRIPAGRKAFPGAGEMDQEHQDDNYRISQRMDHGGKNKAANRKIKEVFTFSVSFMR